MKKLLFSIFLLTIFNSSQSVYTQTKWTEIIYHYQTGTIAPPYYYSYDISITSTGTGKLNYYYDYASPTWDYDLHISAESLGRLTDAINTSNVINDSMKSLPPEKIPEGGPSENLTIIIRDDYDSSYNKTIQTPNFPKSSKDKETLKTLYTVIIDLIPPKVWDELKERKEEYIKSRKQ